MTTLIVVWVPNQTELHAPGCADIPRALKRHYLEPRDAHPMTYPDLRGFIEDIYSDFIHANDRQPWTDYIDEVSVKPCVKDLPLEDIRPVPGMM